LRQERDRWRESEEKMEINTYLKEYRPEALRLELWQFTVFFIQIRKFQLFLYFGL
jgi:hypothetical protein